MRTEDLIEAMEKENGWTHIDPFAEYLSGAPNDEVYIFLTAIEHLQDLSLSDPWMQPLWERVGMLKKIAADEFIDRLKENPNYTDQLEARGQMMLNAGRKPK